jgi:phosphatidylglycerophosphate synthase
MVSVLGAFCVIAAAWAYALPSFPYSALLGLMFHMWWHVLDGVDGDLARITGKASPSGEVVDGLCDYLGHIVLYVTLAWLLSVTMGSAAWWWTLAAGLSNALQSNHAEVQRRQYQHWVYGTPWLRQSHTAGSSTAKSALGHLVSLYLAAGNRLTPHAPQIDEAISAAANDAQRLQQIRTTIKAETAPLLLLHKVLGSNPRTIVLGGAMLAGGPGWHGALYYCIYQSLFLNVLLLISVRAHNMTARRIVAAIAQ